MAGLEGEDPPCLGWRHPPELGDDQLDHEAPARFDMRSRGGEHGELVVLRGHVHDRVGDEVHERERARDASRRHVADRHRHGVRPRLGLQLLDHVRRELDAMHLDTARAQGETDSACADRELERVAVTRERPEEVDHRPEHVGLEDLRVGAVVDLSDFPLPHDRAHGDEPDRDHGRRAAVFRSGGRSIEQPDDDLLLGLGFGGASATPTGGPMSKVRRNRPAVVREVRVGTHAQQCFDGSRATVAHRSMQWRHTAGSLRVGVGARLDEGKDDRSLLCRVPARGAPGPPIVAVWSGSAPRRFLARMFAP